MQVSCFNSHDSAILPLPFPLLRRVEDESDGLLEHLRDVLAVEGRALDQLPRLDLLGQGEAVDLGEELGVVDLGLGPPVDLGAHEQDGHGVPAVMPDLGDPL